MEPASAQVSTGVPFLDHMLHQLASHGLLDLENHGQPADLHIDDHHTNEERWASPWVRPCQAWGSRQGIQRFPALSVRPS